MSTDTFGVPASVALDVGTANTRVATAGLPGLLEVPTGAGVRREGAGVSDVFAAAALLEPLLRFCRTRTSKRLRVLVCAPSDTSTRERNALKQAVLRAGAQAVLVVPEPLAAGIGAGLDLGGRYGRMVIDVGAGVTDIAVARSGALVTWATLRQGCVDLYKAINAGVLRQHGVVMRPLEAERTARLLGVDTGTGSGIASCQAAGLSLATGHETHVALTAADVAQAAEAWMDKIATAVRRVFSGLPAKAAAAVFEAGVCVMGGGARLPGLITSIAEKTALDTRSGADPEHAVIKGAREMLIAASTAGDWATSEPWIGSAAMGTTRS
jgi:rod shape-determining protein MreB